MRIDPWLAGIDEVDDRLLVKVTLAVDQIAEVMPTHSQDSLYVGSTGHTRCRQCCRLSEKIVVAGDHVPVRQSSQHRLLLPTTLSRHRATGVEAASRWRVQRTR